VKFLQWLLRRRKPERKPVPAPPVDLAPLDRHLGETDRAMAHGARELEFMRAQLQLIKREWEKKPG